MDKSSGARTLGIQYGTYLMAYGISMFFSRRECYIPSGLLLICESLFLYWMNYRENQNLVDLKGLFTLSWVGGQGLACFQLSALQSDWADKTWLCFLLVYLGFGIGYEWKRRSGGQKESMGIRFLPAGSVKAERVKISIYILTVLSLGCFLLEAVLLGYIPVFSKLPHAYSYFHISGVHYFTVSCVLVPAITVFYLKTEMVRTRKETIFLLLCNLNTVLIPILCVSRFQLLFAVGFAVVTYIAVNKSIRMRTMVCLFCCLLPVYVCLTIARNHDVEYLNGIFEMKNRATPIFITQPYMYVANNFENFNCLVEQLPGHTYGLKMLFPVFALSGLKFRYPSLVSFPLFLTKEELTTVTMFYDAYYDFGMIGVFAFSVAVGVVAGALIGWLKKRSLTVVLFYGQIAIYLGLSFFTTWFSNPTTWFWFALTLMIGWFAEYQKKEKRRDE